MKNENKTKSTEQSVEEFINQIADEQMRQDCQSVSALMQEISGETPQMWGTIVGFGSYHYKYESGREGDFFKMGFAPRKGKLTLYFSRHLEDQPEILDRLGKHSIGKSCLYLKKLSDIDVEALKELMKVNL
jgi:hypothetical protein